MPVLARWIEAAGIATVVVTMMPDVAEHLLAPRILGVQFPFGHPFGEPGDRGTQRTVLEAAIYLLATADEAVTRVDLDLQWPQPRGAAYRAWQPDEPSPIVQMILDARDDAG